MKANDYDLILMDIHMPNMNGIEATKKIRQLASPKKDIPIIALTASTLEVKNKIDDYQMNGIVGKPFLMKDLFEAIQELVDRPKKMPA